MSQCGSGGAEGDRGKPHETLGRPQLAGASGSRRCGSSKRVLLQASLTELGDLQLSIPRTRTLSAIGIMRQIAGGLGRRAGHVERMILLAFTLGLATRKVSQALLPILGEKISAFTVSAVVKQPWGFSEKTPL